MKITFVCTGNTCRSPIAESIAKSLLPNDTIESRGLFAINGQAVTPESLEVILEHDLPEPTLAQQFDESDLTSDLILTMTQSHKTQLINVYGENIHIYTLSEYVGEQADVDDPFGGSIDTYRDTFNQLYSLIHKLQGFS
ncbi:low molecular weight protein arginine phosphatase [Staphylococcus sp. NRL 16/872]|uniref:low molecular weight protein arginine phosphatase n=1 Tax=Staphylococcus sp. NRL 16/872 TaxID=2930131 RepID=UPI001FB34CB6|nr:MULTISPECIES: low molecular weight protein arginine phosphatase [unclassified Staphylococcus]MCJ1655902.1 low molecular weight protein arginine phosphatase [Staphylococcus sp. NRL 21/187]MCJ1661700.1 low molecular weight protein arginine phosphatase [Staphylococcus sp. NRL 18/288]MCJ1667636.1 low molecular weight protein arginine phosphatase [Staphylococcus sp. NRL 19/737]WEN70125.1 low molecular weight protein arginine phosphatase [Staphylococcus sp. NRL 16/872]